jgi:hypothetical protein
MKREASRLLKNEKRGLAPLFFVLVFYFSMLIFCFVAFLLCDLKSAFSRSFVNKSYHFRAFFATEL